MKLYVREIVRNVLHADFLLAMSVLFEQICQSSCSKLLEQVYAADRYSQLHLVPKLNGIEQSSVYHSFDEATNCLIVNTEFSKILWSLRQERRSLRILQPLVARLLIA